MVDMTGLVVIGIVILAVVSIVIAILGSGLGTKLIGGTNVLVDYQQVDEGTKLNTFLLNDKGEGSFAHVLGSLGVKGNVKAGIGVTETLDLLDLVLVVKEGQNRIFEIGQVRDGTGIFIDFPLPGKRRGSLGIDAE